MKNLIFILLFGLPITIFSQNLNDTIDFKSIKKELINNQLIKMIIEYRDILGKTKISKDTAPMFSAKYHMIYFETYGDESVIHNKPIVYDVYGLGYTITSIYDSPTNRLFTLGLQVSGGEEYHLITEISEFYKINTSKKMTYTNLVKLVFYDLIKDKTILIDDSNIEKYLGVANGCFINEFGDIKFGVTLVVGKKN